MAAVGQPGWRSYLLHLRLPFQLLLSPVYLWGVLLAGGSIATTEFWLGYVSLHLFLYGGTTAFNSYYDRDEGPIGGMLQPPKVEEGLLPFSLAVQALGLIPAALVGWQFLVAWVSLFLVFTAYSHPAVRLKASPAAALTAIGLGQGAIGFALGWLAGKAGVPGSVTGDFDNLTGGLLSPEALIGATSTAMVVTGLYLVTQCYQEEEDRARGDRTVAVLIGAKRSLQLALLPMALGGAVLVGWSWVYLGAAWAIGLATFFAVLGGTQLMWVSRFDSRSVEQNFRTAMRFTTSASLGLSVFLVIQLVRAWQS